MSDGDAQPDDEVVEWRVGPEDAGSRLDRFLAVRPDVGTRNLAKRLIQSGNVELSGEIVTKASTAVVSLSVEPSS